MQSSTNQFFNAAASMPRPVCVTAFITPQSLLNLSLYSDGSAETAEGPQILCVGVYMSDRSIWNTCNFTNAANALNYAFMLKNEICPISKNAYALLKAEIKRTGAVSTRAKARAEAKAKAEAEKKEKNIEEKKAKAEAEDKAEAKKKAKAKAKARVKAKDKEKAEAEATKKAEAIEAASDEAEAKPESWNELFEKMEADEKLYEDICNKSVPA